MSAFCSMGGRELMLSRRGVHSAVWKEGANGVWKRMSAFCSMVPEDTW